MVLKVLMKLFLGLSSTCKISALFLSLKEELEAAIKHLEKLFLSIISSTIIQLKATWTAIVKLL